MKSLRNVANDGSWGPAKALLGMPGSFGWERMQERSRAEANAGILVHSLKPKWEFRLIEKSFSTR